MKTVKKVLNSFICMMMSALCFLPMSTLASYNDSQASQKIIDITNLIFDGNENVDVIDNDGSSVKENFIVDNIDAYEKKDYVSISRYLSENSYILTNDISYMLSRASYTKSCAKQYVANHDFGDRVVTLAVTLRSTIRVNDATGIITSYDQNPELYIDEHSSTEGFTTTIGKVGTDSNRLSSSRRSIIMSGHVQVTAASGVGASPKTYTFYPNVTCG